MVTYELGTGITGMTRIIPNIIKLIAPIINTAFVYKKKREMLILKRFPHQKMTYGKHPYLLIHGYHNFILNQILHIL